MILRLLDSKTSFLNGADLHSILRAILAVSNTVENEDAYRCIRETLTRELGPRVSFIEGAWHLRILVKHKLWFLPRANIAIADYSATPDAVFNDSYIPIY